ncbi:MAG: DUF2079 domain-containing protein [Candidatus Baltobacteraceae bacterium]
MRLDVKGAGALPHSLLLGTAGVAALLCAAAVVRWDVWSYGSDTGTFAQAIAHAPQGFSDAMEGGTHLRFHFSPILAVLWPLVALTRTPLVLQFVQIALILSCPLLLAQLLRPYVPSPWPARCGFLALLYPPLLAGAFSEFHELAFYPPLLLALFLSADRARWGWFAACALLLVCVREDANVDLVLIGAALCALALLRRTTLERGLLIGEPPEAERLSVAGAALSVCAAGALAIYAFVLLPRIGSWPPSHFYDYAFAHGPVQTALALFTHPLALIAATATLGRVTYLLEALAPLAFLPIFSRWSLLSLPALAGILLASDGSVWRMGMHYELLWAPLLLLGACVTLVLLVRARSESTATLWWAIACGACVIVLAAFNPMHPAHYLRLQAFAHPADARRAFLCVPRDAPVATHDEWFAHEALAFPNATVLGADPAVFRGYVVYDRGWRNPLFEHALPALEAGAQNGAFTIVCESGSVRVLRSTSYRTGG